MPVVLIVAGGYLVWFGVHYWRTDVKYPSDPIKAVLQGKDLPPATRDDSLLSALSGPGWANAGAAGVQAVQGALTGQTAIATDAIRYEGQGYVMGGRADRPGNWDCSSFLSYVLGHDFGLQLPGGGHYGDRGYPPNEHGPVASQYKLYGTGIDQSQLQAGDLVVWNTHCGIAVDSSRTIAARTPAEGTGISTIAGTSQSIGESPVFRRVGVTIGSGPGAGGGGKENVR